jgi:hypothetical protein
MKSSKLAMAAYLAAAFSITGYAVALDHNAPLTDSTNTVTADRALKGVPMHMAPDQLPDQFSTQLRDDVGRSTGIAILHQRGNDVEYTFALENLSGPVTSAHFHYGPHGAVAARAYSICGVANESPDCPTETNTSITGVWKNADIEAIKKGGVIIAFHTAKYPAPIGELAVYIPAEHTSTAAAAPLHVH